MLHLIFIWLNIKESIMTVVYRGQHSSIGSLPCLNSHRLRAFKYCLEFLVVHWLNTRIVDVKMSLPTCYHLLKSDKNSGKYGTTVLLSFLCICFILVSNLYTGELKWAQI